MQTKDFIIPFVRLKAVHAVLSGLFEFSIAAGEKDYLTSTGLSLIGS